MRSCLSYLWHLWCLTFIVNSLSSSTWRAWRRCTLGCTYKGVSRIHRERKNVECGQPCPLGFGLGLNLKQRKRSQGKPVFFFLSSFLLSFLSSFSFPPFHSFSWDSATFQSLAAVWNSLCGPWWPGWSHRLWDALCMLGIRCNALEGQPVPLTAECLQSL